MRLISMAKAPASRRRPSRAPASVDASALSGRNGWALNARSAAFEAAAAEPLDAVFDFGEESAGNVCGSAAGGMAGDGDAIGAFSQAAWSDTSNRANRALAGIRSIAEKAV